jgi:hypothetical protein
MFDARTSEEWKELHLDCMTKTPVMAKVFFPHHFKRPFSKDHNKVFELLDNDNDRLVAMALPRGYGKTTIVGVPFVGRKVLYREVHYVLYISCTISKAIRDVKNLSVELTTNEDIIKTFGNIKGEQWAEGSGVLETNTGILIEALGAGSQVRGRKYKEHRPDLIVVDDLEDPEQVRSDERRAYLKEWFFSDLLGSVDLNSTRVILIGTILADNSLLAELINESKGDPDGIDEVEVTAFDKTELFKTIRLEAFNDNLESNWPEYMSNEKVAAKYKAYEQRGLLDLLFREYRNLAIARVSAMFQEAYFKRYDDKPEFNKTCENVIIVDPAKTTNVKSAYTAILGVGLDVVNNKIYLRDCVNKRINPDETYIEACDMADRIGARIIGLKVTSLNLYITYPFQNYIKTRKRYYELVEIKERADKDERIGALMPFYRMGAIYHNELIHIRSPLETQLLAHPRGKYKDVADAFADIIPLFSLGDRFFTMQLDEGKAEDRKAIEDEYADLYKEDMLDEKLPKNWAIAV